MKNWYILLIFVITIGVFNSCVENNKPKIGFLFHKLNNTQWEEDRKYFTDKAKTLGAEVYVKDAKNDENLQDQQAIELINMGVDVLVIVAQNSNSAASIIRKANAKNIKTIAYRRMIKNAELDYYLGFNLSKCGELQARYALDKCTTGANFILIEGDPMDQNAQLIAQAHKKELETIVNKGDVNIIYKTFVENWSTTDAAFEFKRAYNLTTKNIDVALIASDGMANGVIEELEKIDLTGKIIVTGMDADLAACQRVIKGKQSMTLHKPIKELAERAATLATLTAKGEQADFSFHFINNSRIDVKSVILDPILIDKSNIKKFIADYNVFTNEEIYKN